jgi:hypothetical protein
MPTPVDDMVVLLNTIKGILDTNKVALGVQDVWLGDQNKLPRTPAICLEPGTKRRELDGLPRKTLVEASFFVLIYWGAVQDVQMNLTDSMTLAESVEAVLHADAQLGNTVIHSMVTESDPGFVMKAGTLTRATRLTFTITSQKMLPYSA